MELEQLRKISRKDATEFLRKHAWRILGLTLFTLFVHDVFGAHGFIAMRRTQNEIEQMREQIGKLNDQNKSLTEQVDSLKTDPKAIERVAREEMGLARPGEMIYKLPDSAKPGDTLNQGNRR
jgi:cell division protein FtsB